MKQVLKKINKEISKNRKKEILFNYLKQIVIKLQFRPRFRVDRVAVAMSNIAYLRDRDWI